MKACPHCGASLADEAVACPRCAGAKSSNPFADRPEPQPVYPAPPHGPGERSPYASGSSSQTDPALSWVVPVHNPVLAIIASYSGLISLGCPIFGPIALITGFLAIQQIRSTPGLTGLGRSIFGLVTGILGTLLLVIFVIFLIASTLK